MHLDRDNRLLNALRPALALITVVALSTVSGLASAQTLTLNGGVSNGQFGAAVAGVPDTDGDGRGDLLVGAYTAGRGYLYSGVQGTLLHALVGGAHFGYDVAGVGDLDADGRGDLLIGGRLSEPGGRAYAYAGATGVLLHLLEAPDPQPCNPPSPCASFGSAVAAVPDVDGDGRDDLAVGSREKVGGLSEAGRVHLFSGGTGAFLRTLVSPSPLGFGYFGSMGLAGLADMNGDGGGDLLIGAPGESRAYVVSGTTGAALVTVQHAVPNTGFGFAVAGVPDADGDGLSDLLVGAYGVDLGDAFGVGQAYLYSGATGVLLATLTSPQVTHDGNFGWAVAGLADVDGDSRGDLVVGARADDGDVPRSGRVYIFSGASGANLRALQSPTPEAFGNFGYATAAVPDTDGDGRDDLLVGASSEGPAGRAYLFAASDLVAAEPLPDGVRQASVVPNPVRGQGRVTFEPRWRGRARLTIHDVLGRQIALLVDHVLESRSHEIVFDSTELAPGVYIARVDLGAEMVVIRFAVAR